MHAEPAAEWIAVGRNLADDELGRDIRLECLRLRGPRGRSRHDGGSDHDATEDIVHLHAPDEDHTRAGSGRNGVGSER